MKKLLLAIIISVPLKETLMNKANKKRVDKTTRCL